MAKLSLYLLALYFSIWMFISLCLGEYVIGRADGLSFTYPDLWFYVTVGFILLYLLTLIFIKIKFNKYRESK